MFPLNSKEPSAATVAESIKTKPFGVNSCQVNCVPFKLRMIPLTEKPFFSSVCVQAMVNNKSVATKMFFMINVLLGLNQVLILTQTSVNLLSFI
jgi:hypothetical protein